MLLCLGEPPVRCLCCCCSFWCVSSFVDVLHFLVVLLHSFPGYFTMSPALHSGFSGPWRPPPALSSNPDYFWLPFLFHLPRTLRFWVDIFYPQAFFTLRSFPTFLAQPAFIKASLGAGSYSLKFVGLHTDPWKHRPGPSVCLINSYPQSFIHLKFVFIYVNIAKVFTSGENFDKKYRSETTLFSSHENIKQQPN